MKYLLSLLALTLTTGLFAADKLAIAEPVNKGRLPAEDVESLWGMLESSVPDTGEYRLISRAGLKQMMTEIGLTTSSDLVNMNDAQKAKLGKVEGVKYILVSEIGKFGSRLNLTLRVLDVSTGEIDLARKANVRAKNLDAVADVLEAELEKLFSDEKQLNMNALLTPVIKCPNPPAYLKGDFNNWFEATLLQNGVPLQNLKSVAKILADNNLDSLDEVEPKMYKKIGKLLEVKHLIFATITRFEIQAQAVSSPETGYQGFIYTGKFSGDVRVISAQRGNLVKVIPIEMTLPLGQSQGTTPALQMADDQGKQIVQTAIAQAVAPQLLAIPGLK